VWPGLLEVALAASVTHWVYYDQPAHAVCVEPQTAPPDALNLGGAVLEPGGSLGATFNWAWRR
jgi:aldose 1-epimerase